MKAGGVVLIIIGVILLAVSIYDSQIIMERNSRNAMMGSGNYDESSPTTILVIFGLMMIIGGIVLVAVKRSPTQQCPFCAEKIKVEARVCKYCGKELPNSEIIKKSI